MAKTKSTRFYEFVVVRMNIQFAKSSKRRTVSAANVVGRREL